MQIWPDQEEDEGRPLRGHRKKLAKQLLEVFRRAAQAGVLWNHQGKPQRLMQIPFLCRTQFSLIKLVDCWLLRHNSPKVQSWSRRGTPERRAFGAGCLSVQGALEWPQLALQCSLVREALEAARVGTERHPKAGAVWSQRVTLLAQLAAVQVGTLGSNNVKCR